jgi:hypothetical protein
MPVLMRNTDGRALTLTHRQINTVIKAAAAAMFQPAAQGHSLRKRAIASQAIEPANLTAQLHYRGIGNTFSVLPRSAISNCFPGLEFDFRNLWRRAFEGIVLLESNNYVVEAEDPKYENIRTRRLVRVDGNPTMVVTTGSLFPGGSSQILANANNPNAVSFMEWSNSLARVLQKQGQEVVCEFTAERHADTEVLWVDGDTA